MLGPNNLNVNVTLVSNCPALIVLRSSKQVEVVDITAVLPAVDW